jgi:transcriptional regulator with XRE-family HTH domain
MTSEQPENMRFDHVMEIDGKQVFVEFKTFPHRVDPEAARLKLEEMLDYTPRVFRRGSKSQWYCSAEPNDARVKAFASMVRQDRIGHHWNQTEAAIECGMTQPQWSSLENGEIEPLPNKVFELERAMGREPGDYSRHLGYSPHGGDDRELFTKVAEKLDDLLVHGAWAVEEVLERDTNPTQVQKFLEDAELIGLDVIAALAKISNNLIDELNKAVSEAMPKVFLMKQAQMKHLSSRLTSLIEVEPQEVHEPHNNGYRISNPSEVDKEVGF